MFLCQWNFPGKNIHGGCHFLFQGILLTQGSNSHLLCLLNCQEDSSPLPAPGRPLKRTLDHSVVPNSKKPHGLQPTRLFRPWDFLGKDTGVGCHFLLQGIFPTQGSNLGLLHCSQILYWLSYKGNTKITYLVHKIHLHYTSQYLIFTWNILYKTGYASVLQ